MAFGDPYASVPQLEQRLGVSDDGTFAALLDAASREVETFTRRQFNRDDYAEARRFRPLDYDRVAVDDFYTLTDLEVEVNGTAWDVATYIDARPWNGTVAGQIDWPYSDLFAIGRCWPWSRRALITVTAHWGWATVPAGIVQATLDAAVAIYTSRQVTQGGQTLRSETIGGYTYVLSDPNRSGDVPHEMLRAMPFRRKVYGVA